jgi:hypothetical protein
MYPAKMNFSILITYGNIPNVIANGIAEKNSCLGLVHDSPKSFQFHISLDSQSGLDNLDNCINENIHEIKAPDKNATAKYSTLSYPLMNKKQYSAVVIARSITLVTPSIRASPIALSALLGAYDAM